MLRRWYYFTWLSGDHIVEQAVHSIDKMLWAKNDEVPAYVVANGGRQNRGEEEGNIYDHFGVEFAWADGTQGYHFSRQMDNCENGVWDRVYGTKGKYTGESGRKLHIFSNKDGLMWRWNAGPNGERSNNGYQTEHDEMYAAIRDGKPLNTGDRMIKTTLTAMMARTAAYTGKKVTKEMMLESKEQLVPDKISFDMKFPPRAVRHAGRDEVLKPHGWA
jgi:predicted dehydrogenase